MSGSPHGKASAKESLFVMRVDAPCALYTDIVRPDWVDRLGHLHTAYYAVVFDYAGDAFLDLVGLDEVYRRRTLCTTYILEAHLRYLERPRRGESLRFTTQLIDYDHKRLHLLHSMHTATALAATIEFLHIHVDGKLRRSASMPKDVLARIGEVMAVHKDLPRPDHVGKVMGL
ncbi:MAG: thioesterase family protein [Gammaproteobacteria bacterium]|nr:thioesterase family protein [Gammaproteobacteria bacterium]